MALTQRSVTLHYSRKIFKKLEIPPIGRNVLEFFCVPLYTDFFSDLYKKFQEASTYDTNVEYQL